MTTPAQVTSRLNRDIAAVVRPLGFSGRGGHWTIVTDDGVARISVGRRIMRQVEAGTIFVGLGLDVVPAAWWRYQNRRAAGWGQSPIPYDERAADHRIGFLERRLTPPTGHHHLPLTPGAWPAATTPEHLDDAATRLTGAARTTAAVAVDLLRPGRYAELLHALPDLGGAMWEPVVILLAEHGPSPTLDRAIDDLRTEYADHGWTDADHIIEDARHRAAEVST
ncbi:hypothetical protein [Dactylosporangium sp. NPDC051541]|uniref:hypothetical protein n=1 Tax=Dactylosporangium sp. NPDC051541 TaxID=3363977 RepID=UPI0037B6200C